MSTEEALGEAGSADLVRIAWKSNHTGHEGIGEPVARDVAEEWLKVVRREVQQLGGFDYWLVPVQQGGAR